MDGDRRETTLRRSCTQRNSSSLLPSPYHLVSPSWTTASALSFHFRLPFVFAAVVVACVCVGALTALTDPAEEVLSKTTTTNGGEKKPERAEKNDRGECDRKRNTNSHTHTHTKLTSTREGAQPLPPPSSLSPPPLLPHPRATTRGRTAPLPNEPDEGRENSRRTSTATCKEQPGGSSAAQRHQRKGEGPWGTEEELCVKGQQRALRKPNIKDRKKEKQMDNVVSGDAACSLLALTRKGFSLRRRGRLSKKGGLCSPNNGRRQPHFISTNSRKGGKASEKHSLKEHAKGKKKRKRQREGRQDNEDL